MVKDEQILNTFLILPDRNQLNTILSRRSSISKTSKNNEYSLGIIRSGDSTVMPFKKFSLLIIHISEAKVCDKMSHYSNRLASLQFRFNSLKLLAKTRVEKPWMRLRRM